MSIEQERSKLEKWEPKVGTFTEFFSGEIKVNVCENIKKHITNMCNKYQKN